MTRICAVCGGNAPSLAQWFNQDQGYSICARCFVNIAAHDGMAEAVRAYGRPGRHHSLHRMVRRVEVTTIIEPSELKD